MNNQTHRMKPASAQFKPPGYGGKDGQGPRILLLVGFGQGRYLTTQLRVNQARAALQVLKQALADADAYFATNVSAAIDDDDDQA